MMNREFGYSHVSTEDGQTGYIATDDLVIAPKASPTPPGKGGRHGHVGGLFSRAPRARRNRQSRRRTCPNPSPNRRLSGIRPADEMNPKRRNFSDDSPAFSQSAFICVNLRIKLGSAVVNSGPTSRACAGARFRASSTPFSMANTLTSKVYVVRDNIDTDQIIPAEYLTLVPTIPEEYEKLGTYAMAGLPDAAYPEPLVPKGEMKTALPDHYRRAKFRLRLLARACAHRPRRGGRSGGDRGVVCAHLLPQLRRDRGTIPLRFAPCAFVTR